MLEKKEVEKGKACYRERLQFASELLFFFIVVVLALLYAFSSLRIPSRLFIRGGAAAFSKVHAVDDNVGVR